MEPHKLNKITPEAWAANKEIREKFNELLDDPVMQSALQIMLLSGIPQFRSQDLSQASMTQFATEGYYSFYRKFKDLGKEPVVNKVNNMPSTYGTSSTKNNIPLPT